MILFKTKKNREKIALADKYLADSYHANCAELSKKEFSKTPFRYDIINFLIDTLRRDTTYLEIGVRVPAQNFDKINATKKYSVDPGVERVHNPVDFPVTSDEFFRKIDHGEILSKDLKFDVIFIDGLHLAEQVERDIDNALRYLKEDGFIVMHDCNPPTEFHARETFEYTLGPSGGQWNGTTWKAFFKARKRTDIFSCCIDTDWGVGIISQKINFGDPSPVTNNYFEYKILEKERKKSLNLVSFEEFEGFFARK